MALMALTGRVALWNARRELSELLEVGERPLVAALEPGCGGDVWVVSNRAIYINSKPTRANRRQDHDRHLRIPHAFVTRIKHAEKSDMATLTVVTLHDGTVREYSGLLRVDDANHLARVVSSKTGVEVSH
jgi:hypothetical protein